MKCWNHGLHITATLYALEKHNKRTLIKIWIDQKHQDAYQEPPMVSGTFYNIKMASKCVFFTQKHFKINLKLH